MGVWALIAADYHRFRSLAGQAPTGSAAWAFLNPRVAPVALFRLAHALRATPFAVLGSVLAQLNLLIFRVEIPARAVIGAGFVLPHPGGIVIGSARIGQNVTLYQNVTLGARSFDGAYDLSTRPTLEDGVIVGAGAVILGPVTVGAGATVAANSLVLDDVAPKTTVMGVPAKPKGAA